MATVTVEVPDGVPEQFASILKEFSLLPAEDRSRVVVELQNSVHRRLRRIGGQVPAAGKKSKWAELADNAPYFPTEVIDHLRDCAQEFREEFAFKHDE